MSNAGVSRSGRVRKKSAKLMEMDDDGVPILSSNVIPSNFGKHNQNFPKNKKMSKMSDDSEPEKMPEPKKITPIKIPKSNNITMSLPVKKRHPNMSMGAISNLPPVAAAVAATASPMKMNKMPFSNAAPGMRAKPQPINSRIGIVPTGSDSSSSSSSSSTSSSSSESSDSNSDSDSDTGMPKMNIIHVSPMMGKAKPQPRASSTPKPVVVKKEKIIPNNQPPALLQMNKVKPSSFFSPNAVGPLGLDSDEDSDDSDDDDSTSESNSDEEENKLKIVEEPPPKKSKKMPIPKIKKEPVTPTKKVMSNAPGRKVKSANSAVNAAAAVLANLGNPAAFDDGSSNSNLDGLVPAKIIKEEKIDRTPKKVSMREKKPTKGKPGRKKKIRDGIRDEPGEGPPRKPPRPMTAYMLWCQSNRKKIVSQCPKMADFSMISKKMGEVWQSLQDKEKMAWKRKAKKLANKRLTFISTGKTSDPNLKILSQHILGGTGAMLNRPGEDSFGSNRLLGNNNNLNSHLLTTSPGTLGSGGAAETVRPVGTTPIDVAAHLKLLGESLSIIGQRLTEHEGQIAVSGSLSVLLDSTLCALAPLMCLTSQVKTLDGCSKEVLGSVLDNVAYIMPGL